MKKQLAAALIAVGLVGTLAACSSGSDDTATPKKSSTPTATETPFVASHNYCDEDGFLDIAGGKKQQFGDCSVISVVDQDREVSTGTSEKFFFEGNGNTAHSKGTKSVDFLATTGNTFIYEGAAPEVLNQGDNVVQPAPAG